MSYSIVMSMMIPKSKGNRDIARILKLGPSSGLIIPALVLKRTSFKNGDRIVVEDLGDGQLLITKLALVSTVRKEKFVLGAKTTHRKNTSDEDEDLS